MRKATITTVMWEKGNNHKQQRDDQVNENGKRIGVPCGLQDASGVAIASCLSRRLKSEEEVIMLTFFSRNKWVEH